MDSRWEYWKKLFREIVDSHILLKTARVRTLPWLTQEVCALMRARSHYCTKAKKSGNVEDWEQYKRLRNQVTQGLRKEKLHYFEGLIKQSARNRSKTWKKVNRLFGSRYKCGIDTLRGEEGVLTDHGGIAEEFGRYLSSIVGVLEKGNGCIGAGGQLQLM